MKVAGIHGPSTIDWQGRLSVSVFTQGCCFDCPYCHNPSLIPERGNFTEMLPKDIAKKITDGYGGVIDAVVISGGEPCLQKDLPEVIEELKKRYLVAIDTNGAAVGMFRKVLPSLDRVHIDIKSPLEKYDTVAGKGVDASSVFESLSFAIGSGKDIEVRTTFAEPLSDSTDILNIAETLKNAGFKGTYVIQQYYPSEGVREKYRDILKVPERKMLIGLAEDIKRRFGIETAVRTKDYGYEKTL